MTLARHSETSEGRATQNGFLYGATVASRVAYTRDGLVGLPEAFRVSLGAPQSACAILSC